MYIYIYIYIYVSKRVFQSKAGGVFRRPSLPTLEGGEKR